MQKFLSYFFLIIPLLTISSQEANAQFIQDERGRPVFALKYVDVEGHPYLSEKWVTGVVKLQNGKTYADVFLKLDIVADKLYFKNPANEDMLEFVDVVSEFLLNEDNNKLLYRNGFKSSDGVGPLAFYNVLFDGPTKLLKRKVKKITESKAYSSATTVRSFEEITIYYISKDNMTFALGRDKKTLLNLLSDRRNELDNYINENKLNLKTEEGLIKLIAFYNTL